MGLAGSEGQRLEELGVDGMMCDGRFGWDVVNGVRS